MIRRIIMSNWFVALLFLVTGGLLSMQLEYELFSDFVNYHYFNAWAFLNDRVGYDVAIAGFNAYFNPLIELPLYFLIRFFNNYPDLIYFCQGLWAGGLAFLFFKITLMFFDANTLKGKISILLSLLIGLSGPAYFLQIGTSTNEIQISVLIMAGLYLLLREVFITKSGNNWNYFWSGLILGITMGLKLTAFIYCVAAGLSLILFYKKIDKPWTKIAIFAGAGLIGFLITNGFWMMEMWDKFHSPVFPFLNKIFRSEYLPPANFSDSNYLPVNFSEFLFWPFYLTANYVRGDGLMFIFDFRPAVVYLILFSFLIKLAVNYIRKCSLNIDPMFGFLISFVLISYILWMTVFSITRYYVVIEVLSAIFIVKVLMLLHKPKSLIGESLFVSLFLIFIFMLISTCYFADAWGKRNWDAKVGFDDKKFINIEEVNIPDNSLIVTYNYPSALALPIFSEKANVRGVSYQQNYYFYIDKYNNKKDLYSVGKIWREAREDVINKHQGPKLALVTKDLNMDINVDLHLDKNLGKMHCQQLKNNLATIWYLCAPHDLKKEIWGENLKERKNGKRNSRRNNSVL